MTENIIQRAIRKIRPGSGGPAEAISIIDGATGRAPAIRPGIRNAPVEDEDFDDAHSGMPMALASRYGAGPDTRTIPTGTLPGVDKDGNIPSYPSDDSAILFRLFGLQGISDGD